MIPIPHRIPRSALAYQIKAVYLPLRVVRGIELLLEAPTTNGSACGFSLKASTDWATSLRVGVSGVGGQFVERTCGGRHTGISPSTAVVAPPTDGSLLTSKSVSHKFSAKAGNFRLNPGQTSRGSSENKKDLNHARVSVSSFLFISRRRLCMVIWDLQQENAYAHDSEGNILGLTTGWKR